MDVLRGSGAAAVSVKGLQTEEETIRGTQFGLVLNWAFAAQGGVEFLMIEEETETVR